MNALVFDRYGGPDRVAFATVPEPVRGPHDLLVEVHAAALNPVDIRIRGGKMKAILRSELPATLGSDLAGRVVEVGRDVRRFQPGDEVFASVFGLGSGALAELAIVPESAAALKPALLDFVEAASIPMVGLTAWQALKERARVAAGHKVFIPAGSGGIGTFAIQLAKHLGAHVATTASAGSADLVRGLGADVAIDYKRQSFETVLKGYDAVLGTVPGETLERSFRILESGGALVSLVGPPDVAFGRARGLNLPTLGVLWFLSRRIRRLARARGVEYSFLLVRPDGAQLGEIGELLAARAIRPVIDRVFPFVQAQEALAYVEGGRAKGKVVVTVR